FEGVVRIISCEFESHFGHLMPSDFLIARHLFLYLKTKHSAYAGIAVSARLMHPSGCAVPEPSRTLNEPSEDYRHNP
ncbi:MAG: hypothetical protein NC241_09100, partial [Bacteroides sp.]|nr:hypothetical protein [Bacteroides sp.]